MTIKQQIENDIKQAMLSGDKILTTTLRTIKGAALNIEITKGIRDKGLSDEEYIDLLTKEVKRRHESIDMYSRGGREDKVAAEKAEINVLEKYLPKQLSDDELNDIVMNVVKKLDLSGPQAMGKIIGEVKTLTAGKADGGRIASLVKKAITS